MEQRVKSKKGYLKGGWRNLRPSFGLLQEPAFCKHAFLRRRGSKQEDKVISDLVEKMGRNIVQKIDGARFKSTQKKLKTKQNGCSNILSLQNNEGHFVLGRPGNGDEQGRDFLLLLSCEADLLCGTRIQMMAFSLFLSFSQPPRFLGEDEQQ